uniref:Replication factor A C-terminal domain-containing protein n=1 Tax=Chromera velia CCMP2878 TaxID=1169474 RepID=A0A0G4FR13_9ALVE|eukprot:Cvel_18172.t1-p1 / transcript=Cvel_18172.t1 / gene=Cvel_18172 / organism=Chromera_velia_CCMP2878 / gene_product=Replication protein A 70 kDa DNA-binding subunit C, putative / transcript_product=Replication protein A 70 kDa DNA-binding subunit C, putative / location=Cvel_scaffold1490:32898-35990(-) / protein_length=661 / sequence_SO=supercontig / SO=protein_coding / is_pseudo=false
MADGCIPIGELNQYTSRFKIKARVTGKTDLRKYTQQKTGKQSQVFSVDLLDADRSAIRGTFWGDEVCSKFFGKIELGKVFYFEGGYLKVSNKKYNNTNHPYEINFNERTLVTPAEDDKKIERECFNNVEIRDIKSMKRDDDFPIDLLGICKRAYKPRTQMKKNGQGEFTKRDLEIVDKSGMLLQVTLFGKWTTLPDEKFNETATGEPVVIQFKNLRIQEYQGQRSGTAYDSTEMNFTPKSPKAEEMKTWWMGGGNKVNFEPVRQRSDDDSARTGRAPAKEMNLGDARLAVEDLPLSLDRQNEHSLVFTGQYVLKELRGVGAQDAGETPPLFFYSCPTCNKKASKDEGVYRCEKCQVSGITPNVKYLFRATFLDARADVTAVCFDQTGLVLLNDEAAKIAAMEDRDLEMRKNAALWRPMTMVMRGNREQYKDDVRPNFRVLKAEFISPGSYATLLKDQMQTIPDLSEREVPVGPKGGDFDFASCYTDAERLFASAAFKNAGFLPSSLFDENEKKEKEEGTGVKREREKEAAAAAAPAEKEEDAREKDQPSGMEEEKKDTEGEEAGEQNPSPSQKRVKRESVEAEKEKEKEKDDAEEDQENAGGVAANTTTETETDTHTDTHMGGEGEEKASREVPVKKEAEDEEDGGTPSTTADVPMADASA